MNVTIQTILAPRESFRPFIRSTFSPRNLLEAALRRLRLKSRTDLDVDFTDILICGIEDGAYDVSIQVKDVTWRIALGLEFPKEVSIGIRAHRDIVHGKELAQIADVIRHARDPNAGQKFAEMQDPETARLGRAMLRLSRLILIACRSGAYNLGGTLAHDRASAHELIRAEVNASRYDESL